MGKPKGESRGLAYLRDVRPDAVQHLLKFFAESGRHLELKTRLLISVVTKVINFSPRGIEQYVTRALQEGARPDEIIDAVLCAYPCAGLTKVVDAIDVILDLDLPGFAPDRESRTGAAPAASRRAGDGTGQTSPPASGIWVEAAASGEIPAGSALQVVADRFNIALFHHNGQFHAVDNICPHLKGGTLAEGVLSGNIVSCPFHGWRFRLDTGECLHRPGIALRTYPTRVTGDVVEILLPRRESASTPGRS